MLHARPPIYSLLASDSDAQHRPISNIAIYWQHLPSIFRSSKTLLEKNLKTSFDNCPIYFIKKLNIISDSFIFVCFAVKYKFQNSSAFSNVAIFFSLQFYFLRKMFILVSVFVDYDNLATYHTHVKINFIKRTIHLPGK
jgi:hypothetical protein